MPDAPNKTSAQGKTIWLIGASAGIGEALTQQLVADGHFVIVSARSEEKLNRLALSCSARIKALPWDVTCDKDMQRVKAELLDITDFIDVLVYAAGTCEYEDHLDFDVNMYQRVMAVNFFGLVRALQIAKPLLRAAEQIPQLVVVSSLSTVVPLPRNEAYGASKAALDYFIQALRVDTCLTRLRISLVKPGFVATGLTANNDFPMPFMMSAQAAAALILTTIQRPRAYLFFPWQLSGLLRVCHWCEYAWMKWIAPRLTRHKTW